MTHAEYYEHAGDKLTGKAATRAYRAAQNHLSPADPNYLKHAKRIQKKIIGSLEQN